jgi:hypothetical protein
VHVELNSEIARFLNPDHQYSRSEVLDTPSPVQAKDGVYGWWSRSLPAQIDISECSRCRDLTLLYVGISSNRPLANGQAASKQNLRKQCHEVKAAEARSRKIT